MSAMNENAPDSRERACMLCGRVDVDVNVCGHTYEWDGQCVHLYCMFFANGLYRRGHVLGGIVGFFAEDVQRTIRQASKKQCFVCGERGATITCTVTGCERCFHLPCASEGECVTHYFGQYRSFCSEHRPQQAVQAAPEQGTTCIICMDPVGDSTSYHTMVCPACNHAWFHRRCIQGHAMCAGIVCFQCPICRDRVLFSVEMSNMGIRIPIRGPTWEDNDAFASQRERHQRCDASECLYPRGRERAEVYGPWQLLLCRSCAAEGTHRRCSNLTNSAGTWECASCAGVDNASSANQGLASSSTSSAEALGPSHGSPAPESSSLSSSSSQAAPGPSHSSQGTESGRPGTEERTICQPVRQAQDTCNDPGRSRRRSRAAEPSAESSTPSLARWRAPGTSSHSMVPEGRLPPSQRGRPQRRRSRSPLEHRAPNTQRQTQRLRGSDRAAEGTHLRSSDSAGTLENDSNAGVDRSSPAALWPLQGILVTDRMWHRLRRRSQHVMWAPETFNHETSAERSTRSPTCEAAPGTFRHSMVPEGRCPMSQRGRARTRSRSPLRQATDAQSRPRRQRGSRRAASPCAQSSSSSSSSESETASGSSSDSSVPERSSHSSHAGPVRTRSRSRLQRQASNPYSRPEQRHGSSRAPARRRGPSPQPPSQ